MRDNGSSYKGFGRKLIMDTPICDFVNEYCKLNALRLHMPGHKGKSFIGCESADITEIEGADSLYEASSIIAKSEENASKLFSAHTFYSTEGSSLCIRAMIYLCSLYANGKPLILAGRNAHKTFLSACALCDTDIEWIYPKESGSYLCCDIDAKRLEKVLESMENKPTAVYITSPDYLGNTVDIKSIAEVCHENGILLCVDNAHGAYMKFLSPSLHPIDMGADMCCDSAHKTLPVLTGGAYLHISQNAPDLFRQKTKDALSLFGSTSPSYLILQSLDMANRYIDDGYIEKLNGFIKEVRRLKTALVNGGYTLYGNEELKITVMTKPYGYEGQEFAVVLKEKNIYVEFADRDFVVMMVSIESDLDELRYALLSIEKKKEITSPAPVFCKRERVCSVKEATFTRSELTDVKNSVGRVLASASVGCPPAVPIVVSGERIDENAVQCFEYYGIEKVNVIN